MNPAISIIVVNYNCEKWLPQFFNTLLAQSIIDECEIVFVDNDSKDKSIALCQDALKLFKRAKIVASPVNLGFGEGCNLGAENSLGEFLYFVNSDCWFEKDCIKTLHEAALASEQRCAIFSALEYNFEGNIPTIGSHSRGSSGFDLFGCQVKNDSNLDLFTVGTFFFIKRSAFYSVGEFDKKYFVYGEEQDLSWRIVLAGLKIKLVEKAIIHHKATTSTSAESITTEFRRFYANRNQLLMILINSSSVLSLMTLSYTLLIAVEAIAGVILSKKLSFFYTSVFKPWASCYELRGYIRQRRQFIKKIRARSDWWLIVNYFKFGFGHWDDIKRFLKFKIEIK